jgi:hypothetical protein
MGTIFIPQQGEANPQIFRGKSQKLSAHKVDNSQKLEDLSGEVMSGDV